jgi:sigma-E factor negative regulatory protein RseC
LSRIGHVLQTIGSRALISTARRGICDGCKTRSGCAFDMAPANDTLEKPEEIMAANPVDARVGDTVEFDLPGHTELKLSFIIWVVPLLGLIGGAAAGAALHEALSLSRDPATLLGALTGLILSYLLVVLLDRRTGKDPRLEPRILKIVNASDCPQAPERNGDQGDFRSNSLMALILFFPFL